MHVHMIALAATHTHTQTQTKSEVILFFLTAKLLELNSTANTTFNITIKQLSTIIQTVIALYSKGTAANSTVFQE